MLIYELISFTCIAPRKTHPKPQHMQLIYEGTPSYYFMVQLHCIYIILYSEHLLLTIQLSCQIYVKCYQDDAQLPLRTHNTQAHPYQCLQFRCENPGHGTVLPKIVSFISIFYELNQSLFNFQKKYHSKKLQNF